MPEINRDFAKKDDSSDYVFLYVEEAHATDEWPISSSRFMPNDEIVSIKQPVTSSERVTVARDFAKTFDVSSMTVLIDDPKDNAFEKAYAPWPIRMYVIENGKLQYISAPTDCSHDLGELREWLEKRHGKTI